MDGNMMRIGLCHRSIVRASADDLAGCSVALVAWCQYISFRSAAILWYGVITFLLGVSSSCGMVHCLYNF